MHREKVSNKQDSFVESFDTAASKAHAVAMDECAHTSVVPDTSVASDTTVVSGTSVESDTTVVSGTSVASDTTVASKISDVSETSMVSGELNAAADLLRQGRLVAFPTETVYGLGADARSSEAVARIFAAKGRPADNPLIVHIADPAQLDELVQPYPKLAKQLMDSLWPGPLTIVLPVKPGVLSELVTAGLPTVGVRIPDHPLALQLLSLAACPVAAPSANRSGKPSPTLAGHVLADLEGQVDCIVDGGPTGIGLESTVIELEGEQMIRILRPGGVSLESLQAAVPGAYIISESSTDLDVKSPRSPGMKYTHYAPQGELQLVEGASERVIAYIGQQVAAAKERGERTGVLAFQERIQYYNADLVLSFGSESCLDEAAKRLYAALRQFDASGIQRIWAECGSALEMHHGIGQALMNRMLKAAGNRIHHV